MDLDPIDTAMAESLTPPDAIVTDFVTVVAFLDGNTGKPKLRSYVCSDATTNHVIGLLEAVKHELLMDQHEANNGGA